MPLRARPTGERDGEHGDREHHRSHDEQRFDPAIVRDQLCPSGAKTNCPIEPAAVPMPNTIERCSGLTRRPSAESTIEKDAAAMPRPDQARRRRDAARPPTVPSS